jgi:hypothetical protein
MEEKRAQFDANEEASLAVKEGNAFGGHSYIFVKIRTIS